MERDGAFHLLHDLVDMAVEHRYRSETLDQSQRLDRVFRAPTPFRAYGPKWDVGEQHDGRRAAFALQIVGEPGKLFRAQCAHAACLEVCHIYEADEMHAVLVE